MADQKKKKKKGIKLITNLGDNNGDNLIPIEKNETLKKFFDNQLPGKKFDSFKVRVNREESSSDRILQEGQTVTITPKRIQGA